MRSEADKKNKKTSITMTDSDYEIIEQNANKRGMKISPYMVDIALHADEALTPEMRARIQNIVNVACMIVEVVAPDKANLIREEAGDIWSL